MRILIVRSFPDILNLNSYNVQEIGLASALTLKGNECDIVLFNGRNQDRIEKYIFKHEGKEYQFDIFWLKGYSFLKNGFMPSVKKIICDYDVVQVHEYDQIMSWKLYTTQEKPTVIYHGPYYDEYAKGYNLKCKLFDRFFLSRGNYEDVIALTKSRLACAFLKEKGFQKVVPIGVGINPDNFGNFQQNGWNSVPEKQKKILYVGKIEERRNVYFLIDVFRELHKKDSNIILTIIGNGEKKYKGRFLKDIKLELEAKSIIYKESVTQKELVKYYEESSLFLFASNYEIFGMVLLEAMFFGVPVISSINGGSTTIIENGYNGYIIDKCDKGKWVECIVKIINDNDKLKNLSIHASETIRQQYTWSVMADKFLEAYRLAIEENKWKKNIR